MEHIGKSDPLDFYFFTKGTIFYLIIGYLSTPEIIGGVDRLEKNLRSKFSQYMKILDVLMIFFRRSNREKKKMPISEPWD